MGPIAGGRRTGSFGNRAFDARDGAGDAHLHHDTGGAAVESGAGESGAWRSNYAASPGRPNAGGFAKSHDVAPHGAGTTDFANRRPGVSVQRAPRAE